MHTSQHEGKQMNSQHYSNGYKRGMQMLAPMHHSLEGRDMADYLEGFLAGQAEYINRSRSNPGGMLGRRSTDS